MNRQTLIVGLVVAGLVVAGALLWRQQTDEAPTTEPETTPITGPERAEDARAVIAELEQRSPVDYGAAFERAEEFQSEGRLPDAQLLYFFAARGGHAPSAFALATMNDPNHHSAEISLLPEPDAFQAYRWYRSAESQGMRAAAQRLDALKAWAEQAAAAGDTEAEQLLLQWE